MNATIILTSTVIVGGNIGCLYQTNSSDRISLYLKSVRQWLLKTKFNIILVENSGYNFDELNPEKEQYKNRFEVITFKEDDLKQASYLKNQDSKGAHEIFAIYYAFCNSKIIHSSNFIIKITGRFYIPDLERYLSYYNLDDYDCLTQNNRDRCEMVGCHYANFSYIFNIYLINDNNCYDFHIENIWKSRTSKYNNCLICKQFQIEKTQRGGAIECYDNI